MKQNEKRAMFRVALLQFAVPLLIFFNAAAQAEDRVVSRSAQLRLTTQDYRAYIGLLDRKDAEELTSQKDRMLDFVLSFHSNRVLADQALQQGLENDSKVKQHLENARRAVLVTALMDKEMRSLQYPDFEKISRERYEAEKSSYGLPEKRKVAHILIKLKSPSCACDDRDPQKEASEIVKRLEAGADFAELASQYSTDKSTSKNGGLIDLWLEKDTDGVSPEFLQTAFALAKPGDFRQPLETRSGIHIIKLVEVEPWRQLSYDEIKQRLIQKLRFEYRDSARVLLRSKAYPDPDTIDFQALESVLKEKR